MNRIFLFVLIVPSFLLAAPWTHIELGAGNYGEDGHTKKSQLMTVAQKISVGSAPTYIDELADEDPFCYVPAIQYRVLFDTLDGLVEKFGSDEGVFHVNDLFVSYAEYAAEQLRRYARQKGYMRTVIEAVSGDYSLINAAETLEPYGRNAYDSAHLKNPEVSFYATSLEGDETVSSEESCCEARRVLQRLANLSSEGLHFFTVYHPNHVPPDEMTLMKQGIFYKEAPGISRVPYFFPEGGGKIFPAEWTRVFFIPAKHPDSMAYAMACRF